MKILVAVDNTRASKASVKEALSRAEEMGADVVFVTCIDESASVNGDMIVTDLEAAQEQSYDSIENAEEIASEFAVDTQSKVVSHSNVVQGLIEAIQSESPDFVYVGHRQIDPNDEYPVSSVARKLISQSPVPVTVVTYTNGNGHKTNQSKTKPVTEP